MLIESNQKQGLLIELKNLHCKVGNDLFTMSIEEIQPLLNLEYTPSDIENGLYDIYIDDKYEEQFR